MYVENFDLFFQSVFSVMRHNSLFKTLCKNFLLVVNALKDKRFDVIEEGALSFSSLSDVFLPHIQNSYLLGLYPWNYMAR